MKYGLQYIHHPAQQRPREHRGQQRAGCIGQPAGHLDAFMAQAAPPAWHHGEKAQAHPRP